MTARRRRAAAATLAAAFALLAAISAQLCAAHDARIYNGEAVPRGKYPFYFALREPVHCGATLVHPQWLLTAAHCVDGQSVESLRFVYDCVDSTACTSFAYASAVYMHSAYSAAAKNNDVALVRLTSAVVGVTPVDLISSDVAQLECPCLDAVVMGFGVTRPSGIESTLLLEAGVRVLRDCGPLDLPVFNTTEICLGNYVNLSDACQGDSGAGAIVPYAVTANGRTTTRYASIGIVSWGDGCGLPGNAGVYARTSAFITAIRGIIEGTLSPSVAWSVSNQFTPYASCPTDCATSTLTNRLTTTGTNYGAASAASALRAAPLATAAALALTAVLAALL